jgi:hypothetical protein
MTHRATSKFWRCYHNLSESVQKLADKNFALLQADASHPSLRFKKVGRLWSARVGSDFRALAVGRDDGFVWFWIGKHSEYEQILNN